MKHDGCNTAIATTHKTIQGSAKMKLLQHLALTSATALFGIQAQASDVSSLQQSASAISVDTAQIRVDDIGSTNVSVTSTSNGIQIGFADSVHPGMGATAVNIYPANSLGSSFPLGVDIPLTFSPGSSTNGYLLTVGGMSGGQLTASSAWSAEYQYHLTIKAISANGTSLSLVDQTDNFPIKGMNVDGLTPFSSFALIPSGFDLSSLSARLSVSLISLPPSSGTTMPIGSITNAFGGASIASISIQAVPEPASWLMMSMGIAACCFASRKARQA